MHMVLVALLVAAPADQVPDTVVVCPPAFRAVLAPWLEHRRVQGHQLVVIAPRRSAAEIRREVRRHAEGGGLRYLVLIGDAPSEDRASGPSESVPCQRIPAVVNVHWGSEPEIASDDWYADLDDDALPDLAVGRLTADTPGELARIVRKILAYERTLDFGLWRRRVNFVAGLGGFGPVADAALESAARVLIENGIPTPYDVTMTYASWRSPYCPSPQLFRQTTIDRLNEGCLFWVYIGHGHRRMLDRVRLPGAEYPIFAAHDVRHLRCVRGSPIAILMSCYGCQFDADEDCLAEEMLRHDGAPVAVVGGTRVTMPYGMAVLGTELLEQFFEHRSGTLGEALLAAKRRMVLGTRQGGARAALDLLASALSPQPAALAAERLEHVHLFQLIGDPLLRLRLPKLANLELVERVESGQTLKVSGSCDVSGKCLVELVRRRGQLTFPPPARSQTGPTDAAMVGYAEVYQQANNLRLSFAICDVEGGRFHAMLHVPDGARGAHHVRAFVQGVDDFALGAAKVNVRHIRTE